MHIDLHYYSNYIFYLYTSHVCFVVQREIDDIRSCVAYRVTRCLFRQSMQYKYLPDVAGV